MQTFAPGYEVRETLRSSTRTVVYRARRLHDGAAVVLKAPGPGVSTAAQWARLRNEQTILQGRDIEGVVSLLGETRLDGRPALVFRDAGGVSLQSLCGPERLSLSTCCDVARRLAQAVGAMHRHGIVHHDLNPANIIYVPADGRVEIIDFGLASTLAEETPEPADGLAAGTLRYMSPEQTGRTNRRVDYRTDFYALGVTLYELLLGTPPFEASEPMELIHCHLARRPRPPCEVDPTIESALSDIVMKLLAKTPEERYQSAEGLCDDLEQCRLAANRFVLGATDFSPHLRVPARLYGREAEQQALELAWRGAAAGAVHLVLVHGPPGVGKSAVVQDLLRSVHQAGGHFLSGKCDELHRDRPYFALSQALHQLQRTLLAASPVELEATRRTIVETAGDMAAVLLEVVPAIERILGPQPPLPELSPSETSQRRHYVLGQVVRALATAEHPVALYLDDLQWSDVATLGVLESLASGAPHGHLLVLAAYRDEALDAAHPLFNTLYRLRTGRVRLLDLPLQDLGSSPVQQLLAETLSCRPEAVAGLAQVAVAKTRGNPFFLRQFLLALQSQSLLQLDTQARRWTWDMDRIQRADITDNVADLMGARIRSLPPATQAILQTAACIGSRFSLLEVALDMPLPQVVAALQPAVQEGLVLPEGGGRRLVEATADGGRVDVDLRFMHDRVRHAAAATLSAPAWAERHLRLGQRQAARLHEAETDDSLFEVVHHLREASHLLTDPTARLEAARLHLAAGRRAARAAAYDSAVACLDAALSCLPGDDGWQRDRTLTWQVTLQAARAASGIGNSARSHALIDTALQHAQTPLEQAQALDVRVGEHFLRGQFDRAVSTARQALDLLGERLPTRTSRRSLMAHLSRATALLGERSLDSLVDLPLGTDPHHATVLHLISRLANGAFHACPDLLPRLGLRQAELSIQHGVTVDSARGFAAVGLLHAGLLEHVELGQAFGRLALRLGERFPPGPSTAMMSYVVHHMIFPWSQPMRPIVAWTLEQYRRRVQEGDLENAYFLALAYCRMSYQAGTDLRTLDGEVSHMMAAVEALRRLPPPASWGVFREFLDKLLGRLDRRDRLGAPDRDWAADAEAALQRSDKMSAWIGTYEQTWLFMAYDDVPAAHALLPLLDRLVLTMLGLPEVPHYHYLSALVRLRHGRPEDRRPVRESLRKLRLWARHAPQNHAHRVPMVEAEEHRLEGRLEAAAAAYDRAAAVADDLGFAHDQALALERAGTLYLQMGRLRLAHAYLVDAQQAWERWGGVAKASWVARRYSALLSNDTDGDVTSATGTANLDALTMVKVSQALSEEIVLNRLLQRLMTVALENAGAQRGYLILETEGRMVLHADGDVDRQPFVQVRRQPLEDHPGLAWSVVRYVARAQETLLLDDTTRDPTFTSDPALQDGLRRSILCVPIASHGRSLGVLYLQNDRTTGSFTAARCQVLKVLSAQAAISLDNARLYADLDEHRRTLEQRVTERTLELRSQNARLAEALDQLQAAQEQIITQQKLAYLGTLTAGIAHEMRNPLNLVKNFAQMALDLSHEATTAMQKALASPETADLREVLGLVQQLQDSANRIQEHSLRADRVVQSMLLHAGPSSSEREPTNINTLVSQSVELARRGASDPAARVVEVVLDLDPSLPTLSVSARDLARAILNIVGNALSASLKSTAVATVTVSTERSGDAIVIRVRDNGLGIAPEHRDRIFAPFFTTRPAGQGTGLGLSIAHDIIVSQHRGRLSVSSEVGQFAEFVIELPTDP